MKIQDIIVLAVLIALVLLAVRVRKSGGGCCGGGCEGCSAHSEGGACPHCDKKEK